MSRILLTGGAGYVGSVLTEELLQSGHEIVVYDNFMYKQTSLNHLMHSRRLEVIKGDIRDLERIRSQVKWADIIIPLAAIVGAPACDRDPVTATAINKHAIVNMFKMVSGSQRVLMPTTNSAYGSGAEDNTCDENSPLKPISLYAKDKVEVEQELMLLPGSTSFRLATVFGMSARMRLDLLVNDFVRRAAIDGFVVLFESHFKRNYIHIRDVAQAFNLAIENPTNFAGEVFNVGLTSANLSKRELCERIKVFVPEFVFLESGLRKDPDQRNYIVSNSKIESRGFNAKFSLDDGIQELLKGIPTLSTQLFGNL
jgi:nucleoside-diphosphate-sugar epimerase